MYRGWRNLVPIVGLLLLTVPALVFWRLGLIHVSRAQGSLLSTGALKDTTSIYVWTLLAVVYLFWVLGLLVLGIWVMDHLGFHWEPYDRPPRRQRKRLRRRKAGIAYLRAQDEAARKAQLAAVAREAKKAAGDEPTQRAARPRKQQPPHKSPIDQTAGRTTDQKTDEGD